MKPVAATIPTEFKTPDKISRRHQLLQALSDANSPGISPLSTVSGLPSPTTPKVRSISKFCT